MKDKETKLDELVAVIRRLRAPDGCDWDRVQSMESMRKHLLEEAYEACDAIDRRDMVNLKEELGDVLFQVIFLSEIAREEGHFDLEAVAGAEREKMVKRHPHIFAGANAASFDWEALKAREKTRDAQAPAVPRALPGLLRLSKLTKKLKKAGLDEAAILKMCASEKQRQLLTWLFAVEKEKINAEEEASALCLILEKHLEEVTEC